MPRSRSHAAPGQRKEKLSPARLYAVQVCKQVRVRKAYAQNLLNASLSKTDLSSEDKAFAMRLILGVVSSSGTLDELIDSVLRSPKDISDDVRDALRISTYEIIFLNKSPHAGVDQGVELVKHLAPRAGGLANFVLRRVAEMKKDFPFGDPRSDLDACARYFAFPGWLARLLVQDMGFEKAWAFMEESNNPAPVYVFINEQRMSKEKILEAFEGIRSLDTNGEGNSDLLSATCLLTDTHLLGDEVFHHLIDESVVLLSDASAQEIAAYIARETKGRSFLEIGSGRGTKALMIQSLAEKFHHCEFEYTAFDLHAYKNEILLQRAEAAGLDISHTYAGDARKLKDLIGEKTFDTVFVDVPCSGLGTLRRHPEIRWRIQPEDIKALGRQGLEIVTEASLAVSRGGTLVYATCTVTPEENEEVVTSFLESKAGKDFELLSWGQNQYFASELSPASPDAHFAARLLRK
ncbi:MAG: transcription antitermination factor NusB [Eggerthellaceae bacterium]